MFRKISVIFKSMRMLGQRPVKIEETADKAQHKHDVSVTVNLLDETKITVIINKYKKGVQLQELIVDKLNIQEKDYFSVKYKEDDQFRWVNLNKSLKSQLKQVNYEVFFDVKFFVPHPDELYDEYTRYQFYLSAKRDIIGKKLRLNEELLLKLAALAAQSELSDFSEEDMKVECYQPFLAFLDDKQNNEVKLLYQHKLHSGLAPAECEVAFLRIVKTASNYGLHYFAVRNKAEQHAYITVSHRGIVLVKDDRFVEISQWSNLCIVGVRDDEFKLVIRATGAKNIEKILVRFLTPKDAQAFWRLVLEHNAFFHCYAMQKYRIPGSLFNRQEDPGKNAFLSQGKNRTMFEDTSTKTIRRSFRRHTNGDFNKKKEVFGRVRVGSRVLAKLPNNEYSSGVIAGITDKIYVKCDNGNIISYEGKLTDELIHDMEIFTELTLNTAVVTHWPGLDTYLKGKIVDIENDKKSALVRYKVLYDDADFMWNNANKIRLIQKLKFYGPGSAIYNELNK